MSSGHGSAVIAPTRSDAARAASAAPVKTETVESPSPIDSRSLPPCPSTTWATMASWRTKTPRIAFGWASQRPVEPSMSVMHSVTTPVGRSASQPARRRSTSSPADEGRLDGSVAIPSLIASSNTRRRSASRLDGHSGTPPRGGLPVRSVNAVMAREKMSEARVGGSPAPTSGATNPGVPARATRSPVEAIPKSTTTIRPRSVRTRLAGLTSPWMTGGSCACKNVRASATWASARRTVEGASPGVP